MPEKPDRRQFLKTGALVTAGSALLGHPSPAAADSTVQLAADVAVVGAGAAGLAAARELRKRGRSVTVLEARPRIGGRSWSPRLSDGTALDLGAGWVSSGQPRITQLIQELGVGTYLQFTRGVNTFVRNDGRVFRYREIPELAAAIGPAAVADLVGAILTLDTLAAKLRLDAPWEGTRLISARDLHDLDATTVATWMDDVMDTEVAKQVFGVTLTGIFALDPGAVSLLHLLFESGAAGGIEKLFGTGRGEAEEARVVGGTQTIFDRILQGLGAGTVILNAPVREIRQDAQGVDVIADTVRVRARRAIVTAPTAVLGFIRFRPTLPVDRLQLQQRFPGGSAWKIWLVYDEAFWRSQGLTGESLVPSSPVPITLDSGLGEGSDQPGLLAAFVGGDAARRIARMTRVQRRQLVVTEMRKRFGPQAAQLSSRIVFPATGEPYAERHWAEEPWIWSGFAAMPGPGIYTGFGFGPAIRRPFGRVHWAGVDTATSWYATMEGAIQSGQRAAAEAAAAG